MKVDYADGGATATAALGFCWRRTPATAGCK